MFSWVPLKAEDQCIFYPIARCYYTNYVNHRDIAFLADLKVKQNLIVWLHCINCLCLQSWWTRRHEEIRNDIAWVKYSWILFKPKYYSAIHLCHMFHRDNICIFKCAIQLYKHQTKRNNQCRQTLSKRATPRRFDESFVSCHSWHLIRRISYSKSRHNT